MKQLIMIAVATVLSIWGLSSVSAQVSPRAKGVKPGVIFAEALNKGGTYCHLHFPAIQPNTLSSDKPLLKSKDSGDIVDFYGPCDHDPVGYDEVCRQKVVNSKRQYCDD